LSVQFEIVNVVATATLDHSIDLRSLYELFPNEATYNPKKYGGRVLYFKSKKMKSKVSIFSSGKIISVGTTSEEDATNDLQHVREMLAEKGLIQHTSLEVKIQNIVATTNFDKSIDMEKVAEELHGVYEPEQFPGTIIRIQEPYRATVLLFTSGKAVIAGTKSLSQLHSVVETLSKSLS